MGAGIARESVGDICVGKESCDFFVTAEMAPYVLQNFLSAGRTRVHLDAIPLSQVEIAEPEVKEIKDTLASLRLDSVIATGFRIGRTLAAQYIEAGKDLEGKGFDPRKLLAPGAEAIKATVKEKMELFGSVGKA